MKQLSIADIDFAIIERNLIYAYTIAWVNMLYGGDAKRNLFKYLYGGFDAL